MSDVKNSMIGWPYKSFSTGWYQIGYSQEVAPGEIKSQHWFGQDLVMFRTESGKLAVMDAFCPHMGAHLGHPGEHGGKVCGEHIQCPWHGWEWTTEGENARIPYKEGSEVGSKIKTWHVREIDGLIMLWYSHEGEDPTYEWPGLPYIGEESDYYPLHYTVDGPHKAKPQFPMENSADPHHFPYVHGSGVDAEFTDYKIDGAFATNKMYMIFGAGKDSTWLTPNGPVKGEIDNFFWGANLGIARFNIDGRVCIHMTVLTPIDADNYMFFSTVRHNRDEGHTGDEYKGLAKQMTEAQHDQIRADFHIWQHMSYKVRPIFTGNAEQSRYAFIRKHFDQFYPEAERQYSS